MNGVSHETQSAPVTEPGNGGAINTRNDLDVMRRYHGEHGVPPAGFFARLLWRLRGAS